MKAAIIQNEKEIEIIDVSLPDIKDDEVLVKVAAVGLCTFEQGFYFGHKKKYPFAGGHEIAGIVQKVGKNVSQKLQAGDFAANSAIPVAEDMIINVKTILIPKKYPAIRDRAVSPNILLRKIMKYINCIRKLL